MLSLLKILNMHTYVYMYTVTISMQRKTLVGFERETQFKVPIMFLESRSALVANFAKLLHRFILWPSVARS